MKNNVDSLIRKDHWFAWGVAAICLTLCIRVWWLAQFPDSPIGPVDAEGFHLLAVNVLAGRGFAIGWEPPFCPTAVRTPLYPLFVMLGYRLLGRDPARVVLLQVLLEGLTTALVMQMGRVVGGKRVGMFAGLLYAINGTTQRLTGYLLSETLLLPVGVAALYQTLRALRYPSIRQLIWSATWWGLALLIKPNVQFLAIAVGGLLMLRMTKREWRMANGTSRITFHVSRFTHHASRLFIFWGVLCAVLFPWFLRNRLVFGRWMLSSAFAENVARVSAVAVMSEVHAIPADPWTETWEYLYGHIVSEAAVRYDWVSPELADGTCAEQWARQQQVASVAQEIVRQNPSAWGTTHLWGVALSVLDPGHHLWYRVLTGRGWETTGVVDNIWVRIAWALERNAWGDAAQAIWQERIVRLPITAALIWWGLFAGRLAVWGLCLRAIWRLRHNVWAALLLMGALVYFVILPGPIAYDRFYIPAVPITVTLIAYTIQKRA